MKRRIGGTQAFLCCAAAFLFSVSAQADDLNGAWANNLSVCDQVFVKNASSVSFSEASESHGSGFIIEEDRLRGRMVNCAIKARKSDGKLVHLIAVCSTDVALSPVQFSLRPDGKDRVIRVFPGIPEMDITYFRCR
jgi:hypothetical protein